MPNNRSEAALRERLELAEKATQGAVEIRRGCHQEKGL